MSGNIHRAAAKYFELTAGIGMPKDRVVLVMRYIVALATFSSQCMGVTSQFDASSISPSVTPSVSSLFASLSPTGLPTAAPSTSQPTVSLSPASAVPSTKVPTPTTPAPSGFLYNPTASDAPSAFNIGGDHDAVLATYLKNTVLEGKISRAGWKRYIAACLLKGYSFKCNIGYILVKDHVVNCYLNGSRAQRAVVATRSISTAHVVSIRTPN